jgi:hypothetical protein
MPVHKTVIENKPPVSEGVVVTVLLVITLFVSAGVI